MLGTGQFEKGGFLVVLLALVSPGIVEVGTEGKKELDECTSQDSDWRSVPMSYIVIIESIGNRAAWCMDREASSRAGHLLEFRNMS